MTASGRVAVIVAGGGAPSISRAALGNLGDAPFVVAADSGLDHAAALGLDVDVVVGDMDSVEPAALATAEAAGTRVVRHPVDKDATDLDLALDVALDDGPARVVVVTGPGDRDDHLFAVGLSLTAPARADASTAVVEGWIGSTHVWVVRPGERVRLRGEPGDLISLLPLHGTAKSVTTSGLRYPLAGEDLPAGTSRGVSNQWLSHEAEVRLAEGVLLAVAPGVAGPPLPST